MRLTTVCKMGLLLLVAGLISAQTITVTPESMDEMLPPGGQDTQTLTIANLGDQPVLVNLEVVPLEEGLLQFAFPGGEPSFTSEAIRQPMSREIHQGLFTAHYSWLSRTDINILIITPDDNVGDLVEGFDAFDDLITTVLPEADLAALNVDTLLPYDVVFTSNNTQWLSGGGVAPDQVGNALADYIDAGGKVIVNNYTYDYVGWELEGRFIDEDYGPFSTSTGDNTGTSSLGTVHLPDHPIMEGVTEVENTYLWMDVGLSGNGELLADWDDGSHFCAVNDNVVALNILPSDGGGIPGWTGDLMTLYHNAFLWLAGTTWLALDPQEATIAAGESVDITATFSAAGLDPGAYLADILILTDDPTQPEVIVPAVLVCEPGMPGDVNYDFELNILDVVSIVNFILNTAEPDEYQAGVADFNSDGTINVLDIIGLINAIVNGAYRGADILQAQIIQTENSVEIVSVGDLAGLQCSISGSLSSVIPNIPAGWYFSSGNNTMVMFSTDGSTLPDGVFLTYKGEIKLEDCLATDWQARGITPEIALPLGISLQAPQPNPFNPTTEIHYSLRNAGQIHLAVYDLQGRELTILTTGQKNAGNHSVVWKPENWSSGVYLIRLQTSNQYLTQKAILLK